MNSISGAVEILGCTVTRNSQVDRFPESEAFRAFEGLFRAAAGSTPNASGPSTEDFTHSNSRPAKRRKLPSGSHVNLHRDESFDTDKSAVLARVTLDLIPSPSQAKFQPPSGDFRDAVPLQLASFSRKGEGQFSITVHDPVSLTHLEFAATTTGQVLEQITEHLDTSALVNAPLYVPFSRVVLSPPASGQHSLRLDVELRWRFGISLFSAGRANGRHTKRVNLKILSTYIPNPVSEEESRWTLSDFYDAVHVPKNDAVSSRIKNSLTSTELYPYQQRSVDWMLKREGVAFSSEGELLPLKKRPDDNIPVSFTSIQDASGRNCFASHARGMIISDLKQEWDHTGLHGGILAEEMGLGKTVELIALMCVNKRDITDETVYDPYLGKMVKTSGATLIITPTAILEQWRNEINKHAPQLKVLHYQGLSRHTISKTGYDATTVEHLQQFDVVLTSYDVLSKELHYTTPPPDRSLRHKKVHERRSSPLIEISWWRVCLDEAQMVESGVSNAARVARIIPRCNAWAVSGTPLRSNVTDVIGLLIFLRCEPFAGNDDLFRRLDKGSFRDLINRMTLRHTKDQIRADLDIPPQNRVVITVPFTEVEEVYYKDMFRQMYEACFLSPNGTPLREDRGLDHPETIERMREWLVRLRQTCLHSHVGEKNKRALGSKNRSPRTVQEVLQVLIDQNETQLKSEVREIILAQLRRGHIFASGKHMPNPYAKAIKYYEEALETALEYVKLGREEVEAEVEKLRHTDPGDPPEDSDDENDKDETSAKFARVTTLRRSLRSFLELEHACYFFIGNMYYQWKENITLTVPDSEEYRKLHKAENEWYGKAQLVRKELLKDTESRTRRQMRKIASLRGRHENVEVTQIEDLGGIESSKVLEKLDTITRVMNLQSAKMKEWRNRIIEILTMSLVDQDDEKEMTGEEYELSTKVQDELYVYIQAFRTVIADMATVVHGTEDNLVNHEMEEAVKKARDTDPAKRGHAPELLLQLAQEREKLRPKPELGSLRGVVASARQIITSLQYRADMADKRAAAELAIAQRYLEQIQGILSAQTELAAELEKEQEQFRLTMNLRVEFYRQLQHISETVEDYKDTMDETFDFREFSRQGTQIDARKAKLQGFKVKQTYLRHLCLDSGASQDKRRCPICFEEQYELGILTTCGHKYCRFCMSAWWKIHHNCPDCRTQLTRADMKEITYNKSTITAQEEDAGAGSTASEASSSSSSPSHNSIYSGMRDSIMNEIKTIKLEDSYGSKIDMMARHLLWIRNNDPGAKTIIYSQFADFLQVLRLALKRFKIGVSGIRDKNGIEKFKKDPAVECFLLDAKSNSSGLNLVNATYVFLCEPLINPALELQAIARVHRIGQKRDTTVFMYIVAGTVEEAIYDISVQRRLAHMGRDVGSRSGSATPAMAEQPQERDLDVANSEEIKKAALRKLVREGNHGEVVVADDLWKCLFGKKPSPTSVDEHARSDEDQRQETRNRREQFPEQFLRQVENVFRPDPPGSLLLAFLMNHPADE